MKYGYKMVDNTEEISLIIKSSSLHDEEQEHDNRKTEHMDYRNVQQNINVTYNERIYVII